LTSTQKTTAFATRYSLLATRYSLLAISVFLLSSLVNAQIKIKERVEIDPQKNLPYYYPAPQFTPCGPWISSYDRLNPWQVIWNNTYFAPDPYQQMFNFQDNRYGPGLGRRNYLLDPNKNYSLTIQQSGEYAYFTYGGFYDTQTGNYVPIEYIGPTISNVSGSDIGVTGWFDYVRDYPSGLYNNNSKYLMKIKRNVPAGTEIIMSVFDGQETINYHSRIEIPTFSITSTTEEDTLLHYYSREVEFLLDFQKSSGSCQLDGYGGAYPVGIKFYVEIVQGQAYGNLYYPGTVAEPEQSGILISDLEEEDGVGITNYSIRYKADGLQPDSLTPGTVTIRCSSNDLVISPLEVSFPVKYNEDPPDEGGYIIVGMDKQSYEPGDTVSINCKWLTGYNELVDFPAEQSFNVMITGGGEFGMLLDPNTGVIADNLLGVNNGFKVITATSIPYDSVVIRIKVSTSMGGNSASRMITNQNPKSEIKESNTVDIYDNTEILTPDISIGDPGQDIEGFGDVIVKKDECDNIKKCAGYITIIPKINTENEPVFFDGTDYTFVKKDPCELGSWGGHFTLPHKEFVKNSLVSDVCYDNEQDLLRFYIIDSIKIVTLWGYCQRPEEYTLIDNISEVSSDYLCPDNKFGTPSRFITALWGKYFGMDIPLYMPKELVYEEEMIHFHQFKGIINKDYWQNEFETIFLNKMKYMCKDFTEIDEVNSKLKNEVISDFIAVLSRYMGNNRSFWEEEMRTIILSKYDEWESKAYEEMRKRNCQ